MMASRNRRNTASQNSVIPRRLGGTTPDRTIFARLAFFSALIVLPVLFLAAALSWLYADAERRVIEAKRLDVTANALFIVDGEVTRRISALMALSAFLGDINVDLATFHRLAVTVSGQFKEAVVLLDRSGQQIVSTRSPFGTALPQSENRHPITAVFETKAPVVSNVLIGTVARQPFVSVSVPVIRDGVVIYALAAPISSNVFADALQRAGLMPEWIAAIVDRTGRFVARSIRPEQFTGTPARPETAAAATGAASEGDYENVTYEGTAVQSSYRRSELTHWTVVVAVPTKILHAPLHRALWVIAGSGFATVMLVLWLGHYGGRQISGPARALQEGALALAHNQPVVWSRSTITEFNDVGLALEQAHDAIRQRDSARAELHRTTALLESVINMTPDLVFAKDLESKAILRNPAALFGKPWDDVKGQKEEQWHQASDEAVAAVANDRKVIESGLSMQFVEKFTTPKGVRTLLSTKSPLLDEDGRIVGTIGVSTDITEREQRAKHTEFIMHELSHRSKNLLTIIQSIARQTIRQSQTFDVFEHTFNNRLASLARLHDLLIEEEWRGASLRAIAETQVGPFAGGRMEIAGPDVLLKPDVAQVLAMVFHELATNASKYGALSSAAGSVRVTWSVVREEACRSLSIDWVEVGGPAVQPPMRSGFGTIVMERMALRIEQATVSLQFLPTGVVWSLSAPLDPMIDRSGLRPVSNTASLVF